MRFDPKTEKEVQNLLDPGICDFEVADAKDTSSQARNDMMVLTVIVYQGDQKKTIKDYLVGQVDSMAFKIRHFADTIGMLDVYESGQLEAENVIGATGKCRIDIDKKDPAFPPKNVIRDYIKRDSQPQKAPTAVTNTTPKAAIKGSASAKDAFLDDDIPFAMEWR